jgi:hypothetical protein
MPKTSALRKTDLAGEMEVVVPSNRVAAQIRASLRDIRAGKTFSMDEARRIVASAAEKRAQSKKRTRA